MNQIETERLHLRRMTEMDAPFIMELLNDPDFVKNVGNRNLHTPADAGKYISVRVGESFQKCGFGLLLVELKSTGLPVGICGILKRETLSDPDIGFAFLPAFRRSGYAYESSHAVLEYGKSMLGLKKVIGVVSPDNPGSIRLLEKLGLTYEREFTEAGRRWHTYSVKFNL